MTKIEKIKYPKHTYMFFDGELFNNFLKKEKKIEELTTKEDFYQFNEPMIGFITSNEYEMQTHGPTWENKKIHTKGNKIVDELSKLTVVEAAELSKQLEEKWGVSAAAPVAAAPAAGAAALA